MLKMEAAHSPAHCLPHYMVSQPRRKECGTVVSRVGLSIRAAALPEIVRKSKLDI
jgi:hypothetical protein